MTVITFTVTIKYYVQLQVMLTLQLYGTWEFSRTLLVCCLVLTDQRQVVPSVALRRHLCGDAKWVHLPNQREGNVQCVVLPTMEPI